MAETLTFLNQNSGALTVLFSAVVTVATAVYAVLTWKLVTETRLMREVQTEPRIEITVGSFDAALHILRLQIRNIGLGPALNVKFSSSVVAGGESAEVLLSEFKTTNFFETGLAYFGSGRERVSGFTDMTKNYDGKIAAVLAFKIEYKSTTGRSYSDTISIDMSEKKGSYQFGKPHLYAIAQSLEKLQTDFHHVLTGFKRMGVDVYTSHDRTDEREELHARIEKERASRAESRADTEA